MVTFSTNSINYRLEASTNLIHWSVIESNWNTMYYGPNFGGRDISSNGRGFFRAIPLDTKK